MDQIRNLNLKRYKTNYIWEWLHGRKSPLFPMLLLNNYYLSPKKDSY